MIFTLLYLYMYEFLQCEIKLSFLNYLYMYHVQIQYPSKLIIYQSLIDQISLIKIIDH